MDNIYFEYLALLLACPEKLETLDAYKQEENTYPNIHRSRQSKAGCLCVILKFSPFCAVSCSPTITNRY